MFTMISLRRALQPGNNSGEPNVHQVHLVGLFLDAYAGRFAELFERLNELAWRHGALALDLARISIGCKHLLEFYALARGRLQGCRHDLGDRAGGWIITRRHELRTGREAWCFRRSDLG